MRIKFFLLLLIIHSVFPNLVLAQHEASKTVSRETKSTLKSGEIAPNFDLVSSDETTVSLSSFKGRIVVLVWVSFDCPMVAEQFKQNTFTLLADKYSKDQVALFLVDSSAYALPIDFSAIQKKMAEHNVRSSTLLDVEGKLARSYNAKTTPHAFVIDKEGRLAYEGAIDSTYSEDRKDEEEIINYIDQVLGALTKNMKSPISSTKPYGCRIKLK